jgi:hypothetical protein
MRGAAERDHKLRLEGGQNVLNAARGLGRVRHGMVPTECGSAHDRA